MGEEKIIPIDDSKIIKSSHWETFDINVEIEDRKRRLMIYTGHINKSSVSIYREHSNAGYTKPNNHLGELERMQPFINEIYDNTPGMLFNGDNTGYDLNNFIREPITYPDSGVPTTVYGSKITCGVGKGIAMYKTIRKTEEHEFAYSGKQIWGLFDENPQSTVYYDIVFNGSDMSDSYKKGQKNIMDYPHLIDAHLDAAEISYNSEDRKNLNFAICNDVAHYFKVPKSDEDISKTEYIEGVTMYGVRTKKDIEVWTPMTFPPSKTGKVIKAGQWIWFQRCTYNAQNWAGEFLRDTSFMMFHSYSKDADCSTPESRKALGKEIGKNILEMRPGMDKKKYPKQDHYIPVYLPWIMNVDFNNFPLWTTAFSDIDKELNLFDDIVPMVQLGLEDIRLHYYPEISAKQSEEEDLRIQQGDIFWKSNAKSNYEQYKHLSKTSVSLPLFYYHETKITRDTFKEGHNGYYRDFYWAINGFISGKYKENICFTTRDMYLAVDKGGYKTDTIRFTGTAFKLFNPARGWGYDTLWGYIINKFQCQYYLKTKGLFDLRNGGTGGVLYSNDGKRISGPEFTDAVFMCNYTYTDDNSNISYDLGNFAYLNFLDKNKNQQTYKDAETNLLCPARFWGTRIRKRTKLYGGGNRYDYGAVKEVTTLEPNDFVWFAEEFKPILAGEGQYHSKMLRIIAYSKADSANPKMPYIPTFDVFGSKYLGPFWIDAGFNSPDRKYNIYTTFARYKSKGSFYYDEIGYYHLESIQNKKYTTDAMCINTQYKLTVTDNAGLTCYINPHRLFTILHGYQDGQDEYLNKTRVAFYDDRKYSIQNPDTGKIEERVKGYNVGTVEVNASHLFLENDLRVMSHPYDVETPYGSNLGYFKLLKDTDIYTEFGEYKTTMIKNSYVFFNKELVQDEVYLKAYVEYNKPLPFYKKFPIVKLFVQPIILPTQKSMLELNDGTAISNRPNWLNIVGYASYRNRKDIILFKGYADMDFSSPQYDFNEL